MRFKKVLLRLKIIWWAILGKSIMYKVSVLYDNEVEFSGRDLFMSNCVFYTGSKKPLISRNKDIQFGSYCIRGTRIPITALRGMVKGGDSIEFVMKSYNLTREQIEAALNFRRRGENNA